MAIIHELAQQGGIGLLIIILCSYLSLKTFKYFKPWFTSEQRINELEDRHGQRISEMELRHDSRFEEFLIVLKDITLELKEISKFNYENKNKNDVNYENHELRIKFLENKEKEKEKNVR